MNIYSEKIDEKKSEHVLDSSSENCSTLSFAEYSLIKTSKDGEFIINVSILIINKYIEYWSKVSINSPETSKSCWQRSKEEQSKPASVTYNMNILQSLKSDTTFCVTLNQDDAIDPNKILGKYVYHHPVFNRKSINAQNQRHKICGKNNTHFVGGWAATKQIPFAINKVLNVSLIQGLHGVHRKASEQWGQEIKQSKLVKHIVVMKILKAAAGPNRVPEFQSTHPDPENRIEKIREAIERYKNR